LALAFAVASCGGGSDEKTDESQPTPSQPTNTEKPFNAVKSMTVIKHPDVPSYEGAYPDLHGMQVLVIWDNNERVLEDDISKFTVYPPVAFVSSVGTHEAFSPKGRYNIQYIGQEGLYDLNVYRVPIYIPAVIALDSTAATAASAGGAKIDGTLDVVYEDQGVTKALKYVAPYVPFTAATVFASYATATPVTEGWYPPTLVGVGGLAMKEDNGAWVVRDEWKDFAAITTKTNPISTNPEAWMINGRDRGTSGKADATYIASLGSPAAGYAKDIDVTIDTFYKVDKLVYVGGIEKADVFIPDGDAKGGSGAAAQQAWWKYLLEANVDFNVIYYTPQGVDQIPARPIKMADYVRAMYTYGKNSAGNKVPRAALPVLVGNEDAKVPSAVESLQLEYNLSLLLYYYNSLITGTIGAGSIPTTGTPAVGTGIYTDANAAVIDVSGLIAKYADKLDVKRKENTVGDGKPQVLSSWSANQKTQNLYTDLQSYWDVRWVFTSPRDNSEIYKSVDWPKVTTFGTTTGTTTIVAGGAIVGLTDSDMDAPDDPVEERTCEVTFPLPPSADDTQTDSIEYEFKYDILR